MRDGKKDVFIVNADGSDERNLTPQADESWDADVSASKDGKRVLFSSWRDGKFSIYSVDADGANLTRVTIGDTNDRRPRFSPDGKRIAYDRAPLQGGATRLWLMNADGSDAKPLLDPNRGR